MYDALTGRFTFPCPARGEARVTLSAFRQLERLPGAAHPVGLPRALRLRVRRRARRARDPRRPRLGPAGSPGRRLLQPHDRAARRVVAELSDVAARRIQAGRVALELLLLPRGPAAAGLSLVVLPARPGRRLARARGSLPGVPADVGEPRLPRARRPALPQRPEGREWWSTSSTTTSPVRSRSSAPSSTPPRSTPAA